jgi:UDP-glucose 6-dehydrogenase
MGESFRVGIVGCGYVGPVTAACLAHLGHRVVCVDRDEGKLAGLTAKDARGFLSHCGYCSMDQLP